MAKEIKYYEEPKGRKNQTVCCEDENKYSKYNVEHALRVLEEARDILGDAKMLEYVKLYMQHQVQCLAETAEKLDMEGKVGKKLKDMFKNA